MYFWIILIWIFLIGIFIGIPIFIYKSIKQKKRFKTFILIFVYASIIIFTWLGVNTFNVNPDKVRIELTQTNHSNIKAFIDASFTKCSAGSTSITLGNKTIFCNSDSIASSFATYFNSVNKNPYSTSTAAIAVSSNNTPALGSSNIYYSGNNITLITNIGDEDGGDVYLNDIIVRDYE